MDARASETTPLYLDHQASTPLDPRVLEVMLPWWGRPGNPHSATHAAGRLAHRAVETARQQVASLIGGRPEGIVFTSGATEAVNLALRGLLAERGGRVVTSAVEHSCVVETLSSLSAHGVRTTMVGVDGDGLVDLEAVAEALEESTALVTVMAVNNEVGTIQPIADLARLCAAAGVPFHTDAAQAAGRVPIDVERDGISLASLSAHKVYGPQGIGALWCRPDLRGRLRPPTVGGGQEGGLRPGTTPVALAVGFGAACELAGREMMGEETRLTLMRGAFLDRLVSLVPDATVNGSLEVRVAANLNVSFPGVESEALLGRLPDLCLSSGSACSSGAIAPSRVLTAMGLPEDVITGALRIGFGRGTGFDDAERAATRIAEEVVALRGRQGQRLSRRPSGARRKVA